MCGADEASGPRDGARASSGRCGGGMRRRLVRAVTVNAARMRMTTTLRAGNGVGRFAMTDPLAAGRAAVWPGRSRWRCDGESGGGRLTDGGSPRLIPNHIPSYVLSVPLLSPSPCAQRHDYLCAAGPPPGSRPRASSRPTRRRTCGPRAASLTMAGAPAIGSGRRRSAGERRDRQRVPTRQCG
ncbi:uncharacterized protein A4U43_UnF11170 [Asparagus officinalis]|uniref:Uncharacterized protein n=1 Tax=Asparagus officinalis TaxID=4686 RepID=A0A1R3L5B9_ASPOF|nr:uncharacterized protein A4U43_UnF11170 [Asparagus officinalis]